DIRVTLVLRGHDLYASNVIAHSYDLVLRTVSSPDSSLIARKIAPIRNIVCATPDYLKEHGTPRAPSELVNHSCLCCKEDGQMRWRFRGPKGELVLNMPTSSLRTNSPDVSRSLALRGKGVAILPDYTIHGDIKAGRLKRLMRSYQVEDP